MKIRRKHLIYLSLAIFVNILLLLTIVFRKEMIADIGESGLLFIDFFVQVISAIVMLLGISFMIKSFRKSSSFYFWLFATGLALIPVVYYFFD